MESEIAKTTNSMINCNVKPVCVRWIHGQTLSSTECFSRLEKRRWKPTIPCKSLTILHLFLTQGNNQYTLELDLLYWLLNIFLTRLFLNRWFFINLYVIRTWCVELHDQVFQIRISTSSGLLLYRSFYRIIHTDKNILKDIYPQELSKLSTIVGSIM